MRFSARDQGFTLIELLIVISLITILTGAMVPRFTGYIDNQNLRQAQEQVKSDLRSAAVRALGGVGASRDNLDYWGIRFTTPAGSTYTTIACDDTNDDGGCDADLMSQTSSKLPGDVVVFSVSPTTTLLFDTANGNVPGGDSTVVLRANGRCAPVLVNSAGMVSKGTTYVCP